LKVPKQRRAIEVSARQIVGVMFTAVIILTTVFYIGVNVGKKKVINAEIEAQKYDEIKALSRIAQAVDRAKDALYHDERSQKSNLSGNTTSTIKQISNKVAQNDKKLEQEKIPQTIPKQPSEEKTKAPKEEKVTEPQKSLFYTVKLGTFSSEENAINLVNSIDELNYSPEIKPDGEFFHVVIGKFSNKDKAKQFGDELVKKASSIENYLIKEL